LVKAVLAGELAGRSGVPWLISTWGIGRSLALELALEESLQHMEQVGPPPRKQKEEPGGGFDWTGVGK